MLQLQCRDFAYIFYAKHPPGDSEGERRKKVEKGRQGTRKGLETWVRKFKASQELTMRLQRVAGPETCSLVLLP